MRWILVLLVFLNLSCKKNSVEYKIFRYKDKGNKGNLSRGMYVPKNSYIVYCIGPKRYDNEYYYFINIASDNQYDWTLSWWQNKPLDIRETEIYNRIIEDDYVSIEYQSDVNICNLEFRYSLK